jgi:hypothetical protein
MRMFALNGADVDFPKCRSRRFLAYDRCQHIAVDAGSQLQLPLRPPSRRSNRGRDGQFYISKLTFIAPSAGRLLRFDHALSVFQIAGRQPTKSLTCPQAISNPAAKSKSKPATPPAPARGRATGTPRGRNQNARDASPRDCPRSANPPCAIGGGR